MSSFSIYEAIALSHNDAHPSGPYVTSEDVRQELHRLLEIYGRFKYLQESDQNAQRAFCSFCHREHGQIGGLIGGPGGVCICDECVEKCYEIFKEERARLRSSE
jgi:hypothetical protein